MPIPIAYRFSLYNFNGIALYKDLLPYLDIFFCEPFEIFFGISSCYISSHSNVAELCYQTTKLLNVEAYQHLELSINLRIYFRRI